LLVNAGEGLGKERVILEFTVQYDRIKDKHRKFDKERFQHGRERKVFAGPHHVTENRKNKWQFDYQTGDSGLLFRHGIDTESVGDDLSVYFQSGRED
jgi:hypothetical protein